MLERGVESFTDSERWQQYLTFQATHGRTYSFRNTLLIFSQRPDASTVMGFRQWQQLGRSVKKGERGMMILVPRTFKKQVAEDELDDTALDTRAGVAFVVGYVFDVTQTEGEPIPDVVSELRGTSEEIQELRATITQVLGQSGYTVEEEHLVGRTYGYISKEEGKVVTREGVEDLHALKTLFHEKAHDILHVGTTKEEIPKEQRELEAESVAYVVASYYGLDTSDYSFGYVRSWAGDPKKITASADRIHYAASQIIDAMEQTRDTREVLTTTTHAS
jgi:antirestriction protein ArdC